MTGKTDIFTSGSALRDENRRLLQTLEQSDQDKLPSGLIPEVQDFRAKAAATGSILSGGEDRSEVQTAINFWTALLFEAAQSPEPLVLDRFDRKAARARSGDSPPYKGLSPFQVEDDERFFGRKKSIEEMLTKLSNHRLIAVLGLSGSGKSSVVRAGLIPRLREGLAPGSTMWRIPKPIVPGRRPMHALKDFAKQLGREVSDEITPDSFVEFLDNIGQRVMLTVDQFEELFTLNPDDAERERFLATIAAAATRGKYEHIVIITMRSEFDTRIRRFEAFDKLFEAGRVQIPALAAREIRSAIVEPAAQLGVSFESGLPDALVETVVGEPAGLPLLQFALLELWKARTEKGEILWSAYEDLGGSPREILARRADEVLASQSTQENRDISKRIFLALVTVGAGFEPTSQRVRREELDELVKRGRDSVDQVLVLWRDSGLLRIQPDGAIGPDSSVEVAHEALIRNWSALGGWAEDAFASKRRRRVLTEKALAWKGGQGELLGALSLEEAETYDELSELEHEYVMESRHKLKREELLARRRRMIATLIAVLGAFLTAMASGTSYLAYVERNRADEKAALAESRARELKIESDKLVDQERTFTNELKRQGEIAEATLRRSMSELLEAREQLRILEARRLAVRSDTATKTEELVRARSELAEIQGRLAQSELKLAMLDRESQLLEVDLDNALAGRPSLRLKDGKIATLPRDWPELRTRELEIEAQARSVGRFRIGGRGPYNGTTFLVADDLVIVLDHLLLDEREVLNWTVDFRDQPNSDTRHAYRVSEIAGELTVGDGSSLMLLRLEPENALGERLPPPIRLASLLDNYDSEILNPATPAKAELQIALIGYPASVPVSSVEAPRVNPGDIFQVKRIGLGYLLRVERANNRVELTYDNGTSPGTGGSPVIDLGTAETVGIHYLRIMNGDAKGIAITPEILEFVRKTEALR